MPKTRPLTTPDHLNLDKQYFTPKELSDLLGISISLLNKLRLSGKGPKYIKVSYRVLRYPLTEVAQYIEAYKRQSTSEL